MWKVFGLLECVPSDVILTVEGGGQSVRWHFVFYGVSGWFESFLCDHVRQTACWWYSTFLPRIIVYLWYEILYNIILTDGFVFEASNNKQLQKQKQALTKLRVSAPCFGVTVKAFLLGPRYFFPQYRVNWEWTLVLFLFVCLFEVKLGQFNLILHIWKKLH